MSVELLALAVVALAAIARELNTVLDRRARRNGERRTRSADRSEG